MTFKHLPKGHLFIIFKYKYLEKSTLA